MSTLHVTFRAPTSDGLEPLLRAMHSDDPVVRLRGAHRTLRAWLGGPRQDPSLHAAACDAFELAIGLLRDPDPRLLRPAVALAHDLLALRDEGFLTPREEACSREALWHAQAQVGLALALLQGGDGCSLQVERDLTTALSAFDHVLVTWDDELGSMEPTDEWTPGPICTTPPGTMRVVGPPRPAPARSMGFIEGLWHRLWR